MHDAFENDDARADELVLVDPMGRAIGTASKQRAHRESLLHRAFSVVLWREGDQGRELLLAQRAQGKYHSGGLWANSCCSHPRAGEALLDAVRRRVTEELGVHIEAPHQIGSFVYRAVFDNGLAEYEFDHVFLARYQGGTAELSPDPSEVGALRWVSLANLARELTQHPETFAAWAPNVLSLALRELQGPTGPQPSA